MITKPVNPERICEIVTQALEEMKQIKSVTAEPVIDQANPLEPVIENKTEEQTKAVTVETEMENPVQVK